MCFFLLISPLTRVNDLLTWYVLHLSSMIEVDVIGFEMVDLIRDITCVWKCRKVISCVVVDLAGGQTISPQFYDEL